MIVGISGKIGVGKDTIAKMIQYLSASDKYIEYDSYIRDHLQAGFIADIDYSDVSNWEVKRFADKLKDMVCLLIGCTREQLEDREFKEKPLGEEWDKWGVWEQDDKEFMSFHTDYDRAENYTKGYNDQTGGYNAIVKEVQMTPRKLMQLIGTECGREIIHPNIWCNALFADYDSVNKIEKSTSFEDDRVNHGYNKTHIFTVYNNMKQRCYNPKHPKYNIYGDRGITVCEEWNNSLEEFVKWSELNGYSEDLTLDRIDNDKDYTPDNCRWTTYSMQAINQGIRKDNTSGYKGVTKDSHGWRADIQIDKERYFLGYFDTPEEASEAYEMKALERLELYKKQDRNSQLPNVIIPDVRFKNEAKAIKERDGILIRVERLPTWTGKSQNPWVAEPDKIDKVYQTSPDENLSDIPSFDSKEEAISWVKAKDHPSETALDDYEGFDYVIDNNGSLEDLLTKIKNLDLKL